MSDFIFTCNRKFSTWKRQKCYRSSPNSIGARRTNQLKFMICWLFQYKRNRCSHQRNKPLYNALFLWSDGRAPYQFEITEITDFFQCQIILSKKIFSDYNFICNRKFSIWKRQKCYCSSPDSIGSPRIDNLKIMIFGYFSYFNWSGVFQLRTPPL